MSMTADMKKARVSIFRAKFTANLRYYTPTCFHWGLANIR